MPEKPVRQPRTTHFAKRRRGRRKLDKCSTLTAALAAALERDNAQADDSSVENTAKSRLSVARKLNPFPSRLSKYSL
jgi:hypothetical protein